MLEWMKFDCENCGIENWLELDASVFDKNDTILYCCDCGYVQGWAHEVREENGENYCECLPFEDESRIETPGYILLKGGIDDNATKWKTSEGDTKGLKRGDFMAKYGWDPLIDFCIRRPEKRTLWKGFEKRCEGRKKPKLIGKFPPLEQ